MDLLSRHPLVSVKTYFFAITSHSSLAELQKTFNMRLLMSVLLSKGAMHNYIGHNYIGHNYIGHNCIGHGRTGHEYIVAAH